MQPFKPTWPTFVQYALRSGAEAGSEAEWGLRLPQLWATLGDGVTALGAKLVTLLLFVLSCIWGWSYLYYTVSQVILILLSHPMPGKYRNGGGYALIRCRINKWLALFMPDSRYQV